MAIEPPKHTLFNDLEEEREYRADARAALAAMISGALASGHPVWSEMKLNVMAESAFNAADQMRFERTKRKAAHG